MTEGREMAKMKRTEVLLARRIRATRDSHKIDTFMDIMGQTWLADPDMEVHAWTIHKDARGFLYLKVSLPGCTRLGVILRAVSAVKMSGYVCGYNEKEDYLTLRIFS